MDTWKLDSQTAQTGGNSFTIPNVVAEHWLEVCFQMDTYVIQATAGPHGTLSPTGNVAVVYTDSQSLTATPDHGYDVVTWILNGKLVLTNQTTFNANNVQSNMALQVSFTKPSLAFGISATNTAAITWPTAIGTWQLQEGTSLSAPDWKNMNNTPTSKNGCQQVVLPRAIA